MRPQVFSSLTTPCRLCIFVLFDCHDLIAGTCSWLHSSPTEGIGVRVGLFLFVLRARISPHSSLAFTSAKPLAQTPFRCRKHRGIAVVSQPWLKGLPSVTAWRLSQRLEDRTNGGTIEAVVDFCYPHPGPPTRGEGLLTPPSLGSRGEGGGDKCLYSQMPASYEPISLLNPERAVRRWPPKIL
jgi:hypothetical protein